MVLGARQQVKQDNQEAVDKLSKAADTAESKAWPYPGMLLPSVCVAVLPCTGTEAPPPSRLRSTVDTRTDAPVQAQHFEAEAEALKRKEEAAFSGERMHAKGRAAWTLIRQHAREADFRAREERENADELNQKVRDAKVNRRTYSIDKWTQRNCSQLNIASPLAR